MKTTKTAAEKLASINEEDNTVAVGNNPYQFTYGELNEIFEAVKAAQEDLYSAGLDEVEVLKKSIGVHADTVRRILERKKLDRK